MYRAAEDQGSRNSAHQWDYFYKICSGLIHAFRTVHPFCVVLCRWEARDKDCLVTDSNNRTLLVSVFGKILLFLIELDWHF